MAEFVHDFVPPAANPVGSTVQLDVREIEDAGIYEVLQTPGASLGSWALLDALLEPTTDFRFREPLGQSREVKIALSGLFGRFVARAYATRYLNLTHFAHIHSPPMSLVGGHGVVSRVPGQTGDLPDWAAWGAGGNLAIVEAKGSYDQLGPMPARDRAFAQANRARIMVGTRRASFKRYAIATRWGCSVPVPTQSMLYVKDPASDGQTSLEEELELGIGIARRHFASLMRPLGQEALAAALFDLVGARTKAERQDADERARTALDTAKVRELDETVAPEDVLVGGVVTRGGPIGATVLSQADQRVLERLQLRPTFVGVDRRALDAAVRGDAARLRQLHLHERATERERGAGASSDSAGAWVIRMEEGKEPPEA